MKKSVCVWSAACLLIVSGCDSSEERPTKSPERSHKDAPAAEMGAAGSVAPVAETKDEKLLWKTDEFELGAGQERYLCFSKTLQEDAVIAGYSSKAQPFVHHLIFSRLRSPEPEGFSECDVAFRSNWDTLYITGAGSTELKFPSDAGHKLPKGTQLLVQMHLFNMKDTSAKGTLSIELHRSNAQNPRPVNTYVFGTPMVKLPPGKTTEIEGDCTMRQPVQLIAGFPHMHLLGQRQSFEIVSATGETREVFKRDPFNFDSQRIENVDVTLAAGDRTRVTCAFNNTTTQEVGYGESTNNEMCYFIGFTIDRLGMGSCLSALPPGSFR
ncbi:MAG TPA: hypothetical protein VJV78_28430 [Polyangiales bacterium]|nr:hypothetical protein [Polyangiales bacterium]